MCWNILQRNSQSLSMFLAQRHKKDLAKISLEKDEDESDEEANHSSKPYPNKKSPEMHPIVFVSSHPLRSRQHHEARSDGTDDEPIQDQPIHQIKEKDDACCAEEDLKQVAVRRFGEKGCGHWETE